MENNDDEVNFRIIVLIVSVTCLIVSIVLIVYNYFKKEETYETMPNVSWPFINLKDQDGNNVNMLCIRGPITEKKDEDFLRHSLSKGVKYIGCSSYLSYPNQCNNPAYGCEKPFLVDGKRMEEYVVGWCHCFRDPENYIKEGLPRILISESDFSDNMKLEPDKSKQKQYDFICYCPKDKSCNNGWHFHNKNWLLTKKTIEVLCNHMGLKGLLVGREDCEIDLKYPELLEKKEWFSYYDFIDKIRESKMMIISSTEDASPRVLTEALTVDVPVLVNEKILGGWKYINEKTGLFYNGNNIIEKTSLLLNRIRKNELKPREYYFSKHGINKSGKELKDFLKMINPELTECDYVYFPVS